MTEINDLKNFFNLELADNHLNMNEEIVWVFKSNDNMVELHTVDNWYKLFIKN